MDEIIFSQLINNEYFFSRAYPYLDEDYFDRGGKLLFKIIKAYGDKYHKAPNIIALKVLLEKVPTSDNVMDDALRLVQVIESDENSYDNEWLIKECEEYVLQKRCFNATSEIIEIQTNESLPSDQRNKKLKPISAIPEIMNNAVACSFNIDLGHDWYRDRDIRFQTYKEKSDKIPFALSILNILTNGGVERGTLNCLLAGVNVGKSLGLCSLAADYIKHGYNVLYISMEMKEHVCGKRIDSNILDFSMNDLDNVDKDSISLNEYEQAFKKAFAFAARSNKVLGTLKIKQFPTGTANANTFRSLLNEYKLKYGFVPDIVMLDYLGITGSVKYRNSEDSYSSLKATAEECRAVAIETNTVWWTAAQTTRGGWESTDLSMSDTAESAGLPATVDLLWAIMETEELAKQGIQILKQLKSRYADKNENTRIKLGVAKGNQRWYPIKESDGDIPTATHIPVTNTKVNEAIATQTLKEKLDIAVDEIDFG